MIKSNYISKAEVKKAGRLILTIIDCSLEKVGGDDKYVLWFNEHVKGLSLNNTKIRVLEASYGEDSELWAGRRVKLTYDPTVLMAGQAVGGIRLECSSASHAAPQGGAAPGRSPAPVWNEATQTWDLPKPAAVRPPPPVWNEATQTWDLPAAAPLKHVPAKTIRERVNERHPPPETFDTASGEIHNPAPIADPEFDDDIPF